MKIKKYILTETGEVRSPKTGEHYITSMEHNQPNTPTMALSNHIGSSPILKLEVVEEEWKPKEGEEYWTVLINGGEGKVGLFNWLNDSVDKKILENNLCFPTKELAEEKLEKIKQVLRGEI